MPTRGSWTPFPGRSEVVASRSSPGCEIEKGVTENYESKYWGYIYDQMMLGDLSAYLETNRTFYRAQLQGVSGPVLDCACGTGLFLLPLLDDGHDMRGFDISAAMLSTLRKKAAEQGIADIDERLSQQDLESFAYDMRFEAAIIPTNTFGMLATQDAQINALRNIYAHLAPGGRLLLDLVLADMSELVEKPDGVEGRWHTWVHPDTGRSIRQRIVAKHDFINQLVLNQCFIEYDDDTEEFPMNGRWIFKGEFQLLLRLAGFDRFDVFGTADGGPLGVTPEGGRSFWIAYKD